MFNYYSIRFNRTLNNIVNRHNDVVQNMAMVIHWVYNAFYNIIKTNKLIFKGILQVQETYGIDSKMEQNIQYFLDRFLMSRISIRMLINQHVLMFFEKKPQHPGQIGSIDPHTDVKAVLEGFDK